MTQIATRSLWPTLPSMAKEGKNDAKSDQVCIASHVKHRKSRNTANSDKISIANLTKHYRAMLSKVDNGNFVVACLIPTLFCYAWQGRQRSFCRYWRHSRALLLSLARLALEILSRFASFPPSFAMPGRMAMEIVFKYLHYFGAWVLGAMSSDLLPL